MKFTKSKKEPKKSPEEAYADEISTLTEKDLRDLHKDLKIDHYGNSTAAVINTASGVGLFSLRSTIRRDRTESMQIDVIEARMKENGWTPHPTRYRDAVPIALGVAAGTTSGMTFGLVNVEKSAKRTKEFVKKRDLFKTKELEETSTEVDVEIEKTDSVVEGKTVVIEELQVSDPSTEDTQALEPTAEPIITEHIIARKPVPAPAPIAASDTIKAIPPQHQDDDLELITPLPTKDTSAEISSPPVPIPTEEEAASPAPTELKPSKKQAPLFSALNSKLHTFSFQRKEVKDTKSVSVSVTEIEIADDQSPPLIKTAGVDNDDGIGHGGVGK